MRGASWWVAVGLASCGGAEDGAGAERRPSVLLVSLDSTRQDLLSAYGFRAPHAPDLPTTPHIDALAREGALFEDAYATTSWTLPSHCAILTGQPDLVHAVELEIYSLDGSHPTLAETLRDAGYRTAGFFSGPHLDPGFGFGRGFERYVACYGSELRAASEHAAAAAEQLAAAEAGGMSPALVEAFEANVDAQRRLEVAAQRDVSSATVAEAVVEELEAAARDARPFFVFAHLFDPHFDYTPPAPWDERFDPRYEGDVSGEGFFQNAAIARVDERAPGGRVRVASDRDLDHVRALYAGDLAWTDSQVGRMLAALARHGLARDTIVAVVADHGDEFFEHGGIGHRRTLYEEVVRVPMVLRYPPRVPPGVRVSGPVSTADLFPTLLELAGVEPHAELCSTSLVRALHEPALASVTDRGVMSRLVRTRTVRVQTTVRGEEGVTPVDRVTVVEAFRRGPIKITREREWLKPPAGIDPEALAAIQDLSRRMYEAERLAWIDVEAFPDEPEERHSTDFARPEARAALDAFRTRYERLVERRRTAALGEENAQVQQALRGLGYAEALEVGGEVALDEFVLPLPGTGRPGRPAGNSGD